MLGKVFLLVTSDDSNLQEYEGDYGFVYQNLTSDCYWALQWQKETQTMKLRTSECISEALTNAGGRCVGSDDQKL